MKYFLFRSYLPIVVAQISIKRNDDDLRWEAVAMIKRDGVHP